MKKIFLLSVLFLFFISCSSNDDSSSSNSPYNPPSWIQGTWGYEGDDSPVYKFTSDDVCQIIQVSTHCWKESILDFPDNISGSDVGTDDTYEVSYVSGVTSLTLSFVKISSTVIIWTNSGYSNTELIRLD